MALKSKLTKAEFDALSDVLKAEYKANGDNYVLDTDEAAELLSARNREKQRADDAEKERDRLKSEATAAAQAIQDAKDEAARKAGDVTAIETSWQGKLNDSKKEMQATIDTLQATVDKLLKDNVAQALAADISTAPELLVDHIAKRLRPETTNGVALTRVLDANGQPSAMSLEELKKEFVANPKFAAILKGSGASGGGANGGGSGGSAPTGKKFNTLTESERVALHKANPTRFNEHVAAAKANPDYVAV